MPPRSMTPEETEAMKVAEELRLQEAEAREIQREVFRRCGHDYKDVTKERHAALSKRGGRPSWTLPLIERGDRRWAKAPGEALPEAWRSMKYEKCGACGLVQVTKAELG